MSDYIKRYDAIKNIKEIDIPAVACHGNNAKLNVGAVLECLVKIPAADVEPVRHGKWIDGSCSICGCDIPSYIIDWKWQKDIDAKYCPQCGARMDGEKK